jgi:thiamine pyrophosphokinase
MSGVDVIQYGNQDSNDLDKALHAVQMWKQQHKMMILQKETNHVPASNMDIHPLEDIEKSDMSMQMSMSMPMSMQIFVYGAFGGRFDQEMASIQAMYRWKDVFHYRIALYTDETFALLLRPQVKNKIYLPLNSKGIIHGHGDGNDDHDGREEDGLSETQTGLGEGPTCGLIPIGCRCEGVKTKGFKWNLDGSVPLEFGGLISTSNRAQDCVLEIESPQPLVFTAEVVF